MTGSFDDISFNIVCELNLQTVDLRNDVFGGHEQIGVGWAAGPFVDLVRGVGFEEEDASRFEAIDDPWVHSFSLVGHHVTEDGDDAGPGLGFNGPFCEIGVDGFDGDAAFFGEAPGFVESYLREIDGGDLITLFCEPDAVAPFPVTQTENPAPRRDAVRLLSQEIVGLGSEEELFLVVAFVPAV